MTIARTIDQMPNYAKYVCTNDILLFSDVLEHDAICSKDKVPPSDILEAGIFAKGQVKTGEKFIGVRGTGSNTLSLPPNDGSLAISILNKLPDAREYKVENQ